jgi:hypothetical protein
MTLAAVFSQISVYAPHTLEIPEILQQRNPRRLQTNNQPKLNFRFDDLETPTNPRQTPHSAIPFSPCTPKAMSFTAPWVTSQSPAGIEELASSCAITKAAVPAFEELSTPVCRAYYFESQTFSWPSGEDLNPSTYDEDAPMLALQSDSQDSVMIYDRVGERMLEVSALPPWSKGLTEKICTGEQESLTTSSGLAPTIISSSTGSS